MTKRTTKITRKEQERRDTIKLLLATLFMGLCMGITIGYAAWGPKTEECTYRMCECEEEYNNHYECTVHGHECR